jgi:DNA-directed RNA polymerase specialized sigma24 family protein
MALTDGKGESHRRDWVLSQAAFERLLAALGPDAATAGERYERVRARLTRLFEWRGCGDAAELVDRTFDRVARRLEEGAELTTRDPYAYLHGVALHVLQEHWRGAARVRTGLAGAETTTGRSPLVAPGDDDDEAEAARERRLACLERCLDALDAGERRLLEVYHGADPERRIERRHGLAAELGLSANALRIQVHRLRLRVRACVEACAGGTRPEKRIAAPRTTGRRDAR